MRKIEKRLRDRIKSLEKELSEVEEDRTKYRVYYTRKFRWFIELQGKGTTPSMAWIIEDFAKFFQTVKWFNW